MPDLVQNTTVQRSDFACFVRAMCGFGSGIAGFGMLLLGFGASVGPSDHLKIFTLLCGFGSLGSCWILFIRGLTHD